jgi:hypothetical protein
LLKVFIGFDPREAIAYHVCSNSIIRHSTVPVSITPLALNNLEFTYKEDHKDGSNQFIYSRFLVPYLCGFMGKAIYLDADMLLKGDIAELIGYLGPDHDVSVVKHDYKTNAPVKYLGNRNENYPRKNWSSVIVWDCAVFTNRCLTPSFVGTQPGSYLHRFSWIPDSRIGEIPKEWNWLVGEYEHNDNAKLLHFTQGTPCFQAYRDCDHSAEWWHEFHHVVDAEP